MSLYKRLLLPVLAVVAAAILMLAITPATVSNPVRLSEVIVLLGVAVACAAVIGYAVRGALVPLRDLTDRVRGLDADDVRDTKPLVAPSDPDVASLTEAFNGLLDRLGHAQEETALAGLRAQEAERARIGRELHDEFGQTLTFLLLRLDAVARDAEARDAASREAHGAQNVERGEVRNGDDVADGIRETREITRGLLDDVRRLSRELRPGELDDLGLVPALRSLVQDMRSATSIRVEHELRAPGELSDDVALVVYRVTQEALTNVVRHSGAASVRLVLEREDHTVHLRITDDGSGDVHAGSGTRGMRERAVAVGGHLRIDGVPGVGTTVRLIVPMTTSPTIPVATSPADQA